MEAHQYLYKLKVLSYWNLNENAIKDLDLLKDLKYYHIGILLQKNRRDDK